MRKWLLVFVLVVSLGIISSYVFIPSTIDITETIRFKSSADVVFRNLKDESNWKKWWPGKAEEKYGKRIFTWKELPFTITDVSLNNFLLSAEINGATVESLIHFTSFQRDSLSLSWGTNFISSLNPITRIRQYFFSNQLRSIFRELLVPLKNYLSETKNLYGFDIKEERVVYNYVTETKSLFDHDPSITEIYLMIDKVKGYIALSGGKETGYPMLNVTSTDPLHFEAKIAIPTDRKISSSQTIESKWMLKEGNILTVLTKGGKKIIADATQQLSNYISDNKRVRIAIPFQSLITNRLNEPDTAKWITKIYYPII